MAISTAEEIYKDIHSIMVKIYMSEDYTLDQANRRATLVAVQNTTDFWRSQWLKNKIIREK